MPAKLVAVLMVLLAVVTITGCGDEVEPEAFYGYWQETGSGYEMQISTAEPDLYAVNYRRFYPAYGEFRWEDDKLTYSPVSSQMTDTITYDADSDTITITSGASGDTYTLQRVEGP